MKSLKRFAVFFVIIAFALIAGNVEPDHSSKCGFETSFPFSLFTKIFETAAESPAGDTHRHETDGAASLLGAVAYAQKKAANIKVTFIELGSVNCIPCRMMQPVMKQVEEKYSDQVKVIFYDVWTENGRPFGQVYKIRAIPTQIFLDSNGKEYFRHEGFYPFEELEKILKKGGVRR
ncbi:MAG: thioredoxin family protein [Spirochaetota bacterium]